MLWPKPRGETNPSNSTARVFSPSRAEIVNKLNALLPPDPATFESPETAAILFLRNACEQDLEGEYTPDWYLQRERQANLEWVRLKKELEGEKAARESATADPNSAQLRALLGLAQGLLATLKPNEPQNEYLEKLRPALLSSEQIQELVNAEKRCDPITSPNHPFIHEEIYSIIADTVAIVQYLHETLREIEVPAPDPDSSPAGVRWEHRTQIPAQFAAPNGGLGLCFWGGSFLGAHIDLLTPFGHLNVWHGPTVPASIMDQLKSTLGLKEVEPTILSFMASSSDYYFQISKTPSGKVLPAFLQVHAMTELCAPFGEAIWNNRLRDAISPPPQKIASIEDWRIDSPWEKKRKQAWETHRSGDSVRAQQELEEAYRLLDRDERGSLEARDIIRDLVIVAEANKDWDFLVRLASDLFVDPNRVTRVSGEAIRILSEAFEHKGDLKNAEILRIRWCGDILDSATIELPRAAVVTAQENALALIAEYRQSKGPISDDPELNRCFQLEQRARLALEGSGLLNSLYTTPEWVSIRLTSRGYHHEGPAVRALKVNLTPEKISPEEIRTLERLVEVSAEFRSLGGRESFPESALQQLVTIRFAQGRLDEADALLQQCIQLKEAESYKADRRTFQLAYVPLYLDRALIASRQGRYVAADNLMTTVWRGLSEPGHEYSSLRLQFAFPMVTSKILSGRIEQIPGVIDGIYELYRNHRIKMTFREDRVFQGLRSLSRVMTAAQKDQEFNESDLRTIDTSTRVLLKRNELDPTGNFFVLVMAGVHLTRGNVDTAARLAELFENHLSADTNRELAAMEPLFLLYRGLLDIKFGDLERALERFGALKAMENQTLPASSLGMAIEAVAPSLIDLESFAQLLNSASQSLATLEVDPTLRIAVLTRLGEIHHKLGNKTAAQRAFDQAAADSLGSEA